MIPLVLHMQISMQLMIKILEFCRPGVANANAVSKCLAVHDSQLPNYNNSPYQLIFIVTEINFKDFCTFFIFYTFLESYCI